MILLSDFARQLLHIVAESAPFLLLGFLLAGLFRALVPETLVHRLMGRNRFRSIVWASLVGVPLPLCSCSVIPAATALRQRGASRGATTSFLISTPETGVDSISITYALIDPIMTVFRPVAAFATALLTGSAVMFLADDNSGSGAAAAPSSPPEPGAPASTSSCCADDECGSEPATPSESRLESTAAGIRYAFGPLLDDLAVWLIVGFVLSAAIGVLVPDGMLSAIPQGWVSSSLMMLIATPVYICAAAATPVAATLILKGLDPGAALVMLLVGPATNMTTILVVLRFMGKRVLSIYLVGVAVSALAFGFVANLVYTRLGIDLSSAVSAALEESTSVPQIVSAVIVVALLGRVFVRRWSTRAEVSPQPGVSTVLR